VLKIDDKEVAGNTMERSIPLILQCFDIGADTGTPVSNDYPVPFQVHRQARHTDA